MKVFYYEMAEIKTSIKRQIAHKVRIKDLVEGSYIKNEGDWAPNFIEVNGKQISRVNLIGAVVLKTSDTNPSIVLDDGTEKISVRTFEDIGIFNNIVIGDVVLLIGRPREFGSEKYIVPEILKKLDNHNWILVRQKELDKFKIKESLAEKKEPETKEEKIVEEAIEDTSNKETKESPSEKIFNLIKNIDSGEGANIEEVISKSKIKDAEQIIKRLLEEGEVFEVKPGKLKVLE